MIERLLSRRRATSDSAATTPIPGFNHEFLGFESVAGAAIRAVTASDAVTGTTRIAGGTGRLERPLKTYGTLAHAATLRSQDARTLDPAQADRIAELLKVLSTRRVNALRRRERAS